MCVACSLGFFTSQKNKTKFHDAFKLKSLKAKILREKTSKFCKKEFSPALQKKRQCTLLERKKNQYKTIAFVFSPCIHIFLAICFVTNELCTVI